MNTDVSTIQAISSFYTLITASFMLLSTKLQDIVGKKKLFLIGAAIYGVGTLTAALSSSVLMLFAGWAVLEGLGGVVTTYFTWRLGFAVEFVIVLIVLALQGRIPHFKATGSKSELDITGAIVSFVGLVLFVVGILMLTDDTAFSIGAMLVGLIVLALFALFEIKKKERRCAFA